VEGRKGIQMKKCACLILALSVACTVVISLVGCESEESRVRKCVREADRALEQASSVGRELTVEVGSLLSEMGSGLSRGKRPDSGEFKKGLNEVHKLFDKSDREYGKAKLSYKKAENMKGAGAYKEYAKAREEQINASQEMLKKVRAHLDKLSVEISSAEFNAVSLAEEARIIGEQIEKDANHIKELMERAEDLKNPIKGK